MPNDKGPYAQRIAFFFMHIQLEYLRLYQFVKLEYLRLYQFVKFYWRVHFPKKKRFKNRGISVRLWPKFQ